MKPPVEAPRSRQSSPAGSTPNASSAFASLCAGARDVRRRRARPRAARVSSTCSPGFECPGTSPAMTSACACAAALGEAALDEQDVEPLAWSRRCARRAAATISAEHRRVGRGSRARPASARSAAASASRARLARPRPRARSRRRRGCRRRPGRAGRARRRTRATAGARAAGTPAAQTPHMTEAEKSAPVFSRCSSARSCAALEVELLAADHRRASRRRARARRPAPGSVSASRNASRDERVAGEDRGRLAVGGPDARLAAALGVVVERRQVVVDERERVDELDRGRGRQQRLEVAAGGLARREAEHRPHALAAERPWRIGSASGASSGVSASRRGSASTSSRSSSGVRGIGLGGAPRALELGLDLLRELGRAPAATSIACSGSSVASSRARAASSRASSSSALAERFVRAHRHRLLTLDAAEDAVDELAPPRRTRSASRR